jgi:competence protein ComEC
VILILVSAFNLQRNKSNLLQITFFDCGLGDLCLIESPDGEKIMIDSGPTEKSPGHFSHSALPYFQKNGLKHLDWFIITHAHNDHYGGVESVFANLDVERLVVTDEFQTRKLWQDWQEMISSEGCKIISISDTITIINQSCKLKIIHPDDQFSHENINNLSIVARLDYTDFSALFTGDLEIEGEDYLLDNYPEFLPVDVLKAGHHGSRTASSKNFNKLIQPEFVFVSTSLQNRFDFPHPETLETFEYLEDRLIISGRDGALQVTTDGKQTHYKLFLSGIEFIE